MTVKKLMQVSFALFICTTSARAQLPQIRLDSIFPAGGRVGTTLEVQLGGVDFEEVRKLYFDQPGIKAAPSGPNKFKVTIEAGTPVGICDVRVAGKHGLSNPHAFAISDALEEVLQKTPNHTIEQAQPVPFGCAVNGRFRGSQDDFYVIAVKKGQRVIAEVQAERLDSELDATLSVLTSDGREVGSNTDHFGRDPLVDFITREDGEYLVRVWDFHYRGGSAYRLLIGCRPVIDAVLPAALEPGQTREVTLIGRNLAGGMLLPGVAADGKTREKLVVKLTAPAQPQFRTPMRSPAVDYQFFHHLLTSSAGVSNPIAIRLAAGPHLVQTGNDTAESAQQLPAAGSTASGILDRYGAAHWYRTRLKAKQTGIVHAFCEGLSARGDLFLQVLDNKGKFLIEFDDYGANLGGAYRGAMKDPYGSFQAAEEGEYRIAVRNRAREGSPAHRYLLTIGPPRPDFMPLVCHNLAENLKTPRPLIAGASQNLDLVLVKRDGFKSDVTCQVEGLPAFLQCPPIKVQSDQDRGVLVFTASPDAPVWEGPIRVRCRTMIAEQVIERTALASVMTYNPVTNSQTDPQLQLPSRLSRQVWIAVRPGPAPFSLQASAPATFVRAKKLPVKVAVRRSANCKGKIVLTALQLPGGWNMPKVEIAAGASEASFAVDLPANAVADTYTFALRGETMTPVRDPKKEAAVALPSNLLTVAVKDK